MRRIAVLVAVSALAAGPAFAQGGVRDNCGCGLGTMLLKDTRPTLVAQMAVTILNAFSGTQTFGITSGTSECNPSDGFVQNREVLEFVDANLDQIARDMAMGSGDTLEALADLMALSSEERPEAFAKLQGSFGTIFPTAHVTATDVLTGIESALKS